MNGAARWVLLALAAVWFGTATLRPLAKADEGRYAEIAREMAVSGDWITPRLNGFKYFEKPPLQYWITAASFSVVGFHDWAARLWPALAAVLGVLCTLHAGNRLFGPPIGFHASVVLAGTLLYAAVGQINTLDMGMTLFLSAAVFAFALAQRDEADARERRRWMLAAWSACGLAVLSKGVAGIVLPLATVALYVLLRRDWALLKRIELIRGTALFLAITMPWFAAVMHANEEFARFFFLQEHFQRFLTRIHGRYQPWWYFVPILLAGAASWVWIMLPALLRAVRDESAARFRPAFFLALWVAFVFAFFSASSSKLPSYIVPILPALAVLIARYLHAHWPRRLFLVQAATLAAGGLAVMALSQKWAHSDTLGGQSAYAPWLAAAAGAVTVCALVALVWAWRDRRQRAILALACGGFLGVQIGVIGYGTLASEFSAARLVEQARPHLAADAPIYAVDAYDHTIPWYLGRTVTMVAYKDELSKAIEWEPQRFIADLPSFALAWAAQRQAFAFFSLRDYDAYRIRYQLPVRELARNSRYVLVAKP